MAMDDPIVYPGQTGKSHDHSFIGNRSTSASSTNASLLASDGTTCDTRDDRSAYWLPTLSIDGKAVAPLVAHVYYRKATAAPITAFPAGFRMIAGDSHATAAQPLSVVSWSCGHEAGIAPSTTPPTCPDAGRNGLRLRVAFPSCWDGTSFDSADHKSHMAYPVNGVCPADHPVATPKLVVIYHYPTTGGSGVTLASGGQLTGHADFMNAWLPGTLEARVAGLNQAPPAPAAAS